MKTHLFFSLSYILTVSDIDMEDKTCQWPQSVTAIRYFTKIHTHKVDMMFIYTRVCIQTCTRVVKLECPKNNNIDNKLYWCCTPDCLSNKFPPQWLMSPGRVREQIYSYIYFPASFTESLCFGYFTTDTSCRLNPAAPVSWEELSRNAEEGAECVNCDTPKHKRADCDLQTWNISGRHKILHTLVMWRKRKRRR